VLVTFVLNACFESAEKELPETQVPAAILEAFNQAYPKAIVREYSEEIEDGQKSTKSLLEKMVTKLMFFILRTAWLSK